MREDDIDPFVDTPGREVQRCSSVRDGGRMPAACGSDPVHADWQLLEPVCARCAARRARRRWAADRAVVDVYRAHAGARNRRAVRREHPAGDDSRSPDQPCAARVRARAGAADDPPPAAVSARGGYQSAALHAIAATTTYGSHFFDLRAGNVVLRRERRCVASIRLQPAARGSVSGLPVSTDARKFRP